jgi:hypothetical protein
MIFQVNDIVRYGYNNGKHSLIRLLRYNSRFRRWYGVEYSGKEIRVQVHGLRPASPEEIKMFERDERMMTEYKKYIIVKNIGTGEYECLTFPDDQLHHDVYMDYVPKQKAPIVLMSAGFYLKSPGRPVKAFGASESLGIGSRPEEDAKIIEEYLNGTNIP